MEFLAAVKPPQKVLIEVVTKPPIIVSKKRKTKNNKEKLGAFATVLTIAAKGEV